MKRIGIYGGSFNPVHLGHLILGREAVEQLKLEKLIFVPAAISPHRLEEKMATNAMRLEMLQTAIEGETDFEVTDCELQRPAPSYTIDTIELLKQRYPERELVFLVGEDNLKRLPEWHRFQELEKMVEFVVLRRGGPTRQHRYRTVERSIDISATEIRKRVAAGQSIRYLVPESVDVLIHKNQLYREAPR